MGRVPSRDVRVGEDPASSIVGTHCMSVLDTWKALPCVNQRLWKFRAGTRNSDRNRDCGLRGCPGTSIRPSGGGFLLSQSQQELQEGDVLGTWLISAALGGCLEKSIDPK